MPLAPALPSVTTPALRSGLVDVMKPGIGVDPVSAVVAWRSVDVRPEMLQRPVERDRHVAILAEIVARDGNQPGRLIVLQLPQVQSQ